MRSSSVLELVEVVGLLDPRALQVLRDLLGLRHELVERRVEQADRDRQALHLLEEALEVALLEREQLAERGAALLLGLGHDHRAHLRLAVRRHEHVLGAAEADPLGAELAGAAGVLGRVGVGADAERAELVRPAQHGLELVRDLGLLERDVVGGDHARAAVDGDQVALRRAACRSR